jgi:hypothetical protein
MAQQSSQSAQLSEEFVQDSSSDDEVSRSPQTSTPATVPEKRKEQGKDARAPISESSDSDSGSAESSEAEPEQDSRRRAQDDSAASNTSKSKRQKTLRY